MITLTLLSLLAQDGDFVAVGATLKGSWIWAAEGVKIRRSGPGAYDGFPVEKDPARPGEAVVAIDIPEAPASGVIHAGLAFRADYGIVDASKLAGGVLELWVKGDAGGEDTEIGLYGKDAADQQTMGLVTLSAYAKVTKEWSRVRIPLKEIVAKGTMLDLTRVTQVSFHSIPGKTKMSLRLAGVRLL
jgi:hypothetical protein